MLPIFHIVTTACSNKMNDPPTKPRRKRVEVPIHKKQEESIKRTYSANFNSRRCRQKPNDDRFAEIILEIPDSENTKANKKHLHKEIQRLSKENEDIVAKFNELEGLSVKKITKLKEKIGSLQGLNHNLVKENEIIKIQYGELLKNFEDAKEQLGAPKHCDDCDELKQSVEKLNQENGLLTNDKKELSEDLNMLKNVVYRLNMHLERYQELLRKNNLKVPMPSLPMTCSSVLETSPSSPIVLGTIISESHRNHKHTPIAWGSVHSHTLGPLLDAYQDVVTEKEELISKYEIEMSDFTGRLKEIIRENEALHMRLTEDDECSVKLQQQIINLKSELKSVREQNDILIKKCALKQDKVEEVIKCYEHKVEQLKRDYNVAQEQYYRVRSELTMTREKNKALTDSQEDLKNERHNYIPISVHTASVNECKRWYEELKVQYEAEKSKMKEVLESKSTLIYELEKKVKSLAKFKDDLESKIAHLEKHIKKHETRYLELEHTLNEVKLSRSAYKKQLHKAMLFAKDMVAEQETLLNALNQRQLENKAVKKIGSDMANKMDSLRTQLKDVQKCAWHEFSSVEQRIQDQEMTIENMKCEHEEEIERLHQIIREHEEVNNKLKNGKMVPVPHYVLYRNKHK